MDLVWWAWIIAAFVAGNAIGLFCGAVLVFYVESQSNHLDSQGERRYDS